MGKMHEEGRQAAHVLVDMVSAFDDQAGDETNSASMRLALQRLNDVGAVIATTDGAEAETVNLDLSGLLGGAAVCLQWLASGYAECAGRGREEILVGLREFLDGDHH